MGDELKWAFVADIDKEVGDVLKSCLTRSKSDTRDELIALSKEVLQEARGDIYDLCKNRLFDSDDQESTAAWDKREWTLKDRRHQKWLADDIIELCQFAAGNTDKFPREILVKKSSGASVKDMNGDGRPLGPIAKKDIADIAIQSEKLATVIADVEVLKNQIKTFEPCLSCKEKIDKFREEFTKEVTGLHGLIAELNTDKDNANARVQEVQAQDNNQNPGQQASAKPPAKPKDENVAAAAESPIDAADVKPVDLSTNKAPPQNGAHVREWPPLQRAPLPASASGGQDPQVSVQSRPAPPPHGPGSRTTAPDREGYSTVLTRQEAKDIKQTKTPAPRVNRPPKSNLRKPAPMFDLEGAPKIVSHELYLENLRIPEGATNKAIAESVIEYGKKNHVRVLSCWVRRNKFVRDVVGCKISVPSTQSNKCKVQPIWPEHVVCRDWFARHEIMGNQDQTRSSRGNYQDSSEDRQYRNRSDQRRPNSQRRFNRQDKSFELDGHSNWGRSSRYNDSYRNDSYESNDHWRNDNDYENEGWSYDKWDEILAEGSRSRE